MNKSSTSYTKEDNFGYVSNSGFVFIWFVPGMMFRYAK